jgi:hypothetical protein
MPRTKRPKPLYQRGEYRLYAREGRAHEIIWYDGRRKRERCVSAGTTDLARAIIATDNAYVAAHGGIQCCPTCKRPFDQRGAAVTVLIANYLETRPSGDAMRPRLDHVLLYLDHPDRVETTSEQVTEGWISNFRAWMRARTDRERAPGTIENSIIGLAAAFRMAKVEPLFKPIATIEVNRTPEYRASIAEMAAMFRYCLEPDAETEALRLRKIRERSALLRYLRASVATWARPDAVMDISTAPERRQWLSNARVLRLNPDGRRQSKKYRAALPIARQFAPHLDQTVGFYVGVQSVRSAWEGMCNHLGMPGQRESGRKLIRRSISHHARKIIGEAQWTQGQMFLGHRKASTSDLYALFDPANLGIALAATESLIDQIETLAPGAFYRDFTATGGNVASIGRAGNG